MATLTAWKFDTPEGAAEAESILVGLSKEELIHIYDAATVEWQPGKKKPKTRQLNSLTGAGALGGAGAAGGLRDLLRLGGVDDAVDRDAGLALVAPDAAHGLGAVLAVRAQPVAERAQLALQGHHVVPARAPAQGARGAGVGGALTRGPAARCGAGARRGAARVIPGRGAGAGGGAEDDRRGGGYGNEKDERSPVRS